MKLMSYLNHHQLLNQKQNGFRSGHSTESALRHMTDTWLLAIRDVNILGCVLVDFCKAFDLVEHIILGSDCISLEDARRQLNMLSFEELVFINKAMVMFKVTRGISPRSSSDKAYIFPS